MIDGRTTFSGRIPGLNHTRLALYAYGETLFIRPSLCPLEPDLLLEKAERALRMKKYREAASCLLRARQADGKHAGVQAMLGEALRRLDYLGEAARAYPRATR